MKQSLLDTLKQARDSIKDMQVYLACIKHESLVTLMQPHAAEDFDTSELSLSNLTTSIAELEKAEPVAWLYKSKHTTPVVSMERNDWADSGSGLWTETPLYLHSSDDEKLREDAARYRELLFAVGNKYPNESRHETALRYIKQAESASCDAARAAEGERNGL